MSSGVQRRQFMFVLKSWLRSSLLPFLPNRKIKEWAIIFSRVQARSARSGLSVSAEAIYNEI
jgi:hypothetical protein